MMFKDKKNEVIYSLIQIEDSWTDILAHWIEFQ